MNTRQDERPVAAFGYSLAVVSVLSALLVVLKEKNEAVMLLMKAATGHHWITHGLLVLIAFVVLGLVFAKATQQPSGASGLNRVAATILVSTMASGLILAAFFLFWAR